jgi:spermidine/putrescine transport system substrate-binding protein
MAKPLSRRDFLVRSGLLAVGGSGVLAACSSDSHSGSDSGSGSTDSAASGAGAGSGSGSGKKGVVRIGTWPLYIENDTDPQESATIKAFTKATGIKVEYSSTIDGNDSFTSKYEGDLKAGKDIGFDIVVPTSWMAARWIKNGWTQEIPADLVPNKANLIDSLANPVWDAGRKFSLPFSIIQTGIAYYPDKVGGDIANLAGLLDPKLKGKVTILNELRDAVGLFLLADGVKPEDASIDQCLAAIGKIKAARSGGQFRKVTGNGYIEDLRLGDVSACMAWSGDVASIQAEKPDLKWVLPSDGAMSSVDTMIIPKGGNAEMAAAWLNFLYDPTVSGPLFEAISYSSPVKDAGKSMSAEAAGNVLINPAADANLHEFRQLTDEENVTLETAFAEATQQ